MRKLLLGLLLLVTFAVNAQEEFTRHYDRIVYHKNGVDGNIIAARNTIIYNYIDTYGLRIIMKNKTLVMRRISVVTTGYTNNNVKYQIATYSDKSGFEIRLQIFDDSDYGVRLLFDDGDSVTLYH